MGRQLGSCVILAENKAKVMASCTKLSPRRRGSEQLSSIWAQHGLAEASRGCFFCWACHREPAAWAKPQFWEWLKWLPDSLCGSLWPTSCNTAAHKHTSLPELQRSFQESFFDTFILISPFLFSFLLPGLSPTLFLNCLIIKSEKNIYLSFILML